MKMSGGEVVCTGWLRKSPPEKKLRRYAWKKRWFVLRSGRMTGDPDILEYYKNNHAKKPIRVIDLNLCEQVDAGLTFNKKDLEHSFIFDIKTIDRIFYLVADTEEEMNKWVRCICDICGFNPTDSEDSAKNSHQVNVPGGLVVDMAPSGGPGGALGASALANLPPPYQPVSIRPLGSSSSLDEPQDYLWLLNCESKKPEPTRARGECSKSTSSEPDCNDNLPSHHTPTSSSSSRHASVNGFFPTQHAPGLYDSPPARGQSLSADSQGLYLLPRSYSQDTVLLPKSASSPLGPDGEPGELYVFNTPGRKPSFEAQLRNLSVSYDIPPTPGSNCTYQIPRTAGVEAVSGATDVVPPPRPPKPLLTTGTVPPERSPTDTYVVPRSVSETDGNYCVPSSTGGNKALRSNTIGTVDSSRLRKDYGSQDCYDIPRPFPPDKSCSFDFNESFNNYFKNKGMVPVGGVSTEEMDENYVPMSVHSSSHQRSGSLSEPIQEPNYVPMTPGTVEFSSLGKQVPPPAHMGFRSSPKTPPRRPVHIPECQPPPVDRNLKPDRKGQSPKINRAVGLERTDSQTIGEFSRRRKVKPAPLEIKPLAEWEEYTAPVRSPVTRSFTRDPSRCTAAPRPSSGHSTASSSDSDDCDENYVAMQHANMSTDEPNVKLAAPMNADGGGSPMVKPKGDKQVEYLDLDLDPGKSTPPRKKKSNGTGISASDERVDYVVVDQQRTQALKSTREAWSDERQSTEQDPPNKGTK
ncbi:GRB2-associated-binding protein 1 isoform X4 [Carassius auratus]|uniref:GRB2-associated-binding protein 1 isoform X4 n=1 Tax=Carassius auratus TaxID=7957 RepID=A0A6P6JKI8_CARAU|nr:GRB2-associated-binding protein 1-like isoform X4 [Carassius auratus]XP_052401596.1 GRB2-associated-binding protein 1 isoform X4 [Carassius gibelio]